MSIVTTTDCSGNLVKYFRPWSRTRIRNTNNGVSEKELAMRRKVEVLKHQQNQNKLTKAQRISMASRNSLTRKKAWASQNQIPDQTNPNTSNLTRTGNTLQCLNYFKNSGYTNESDVPGKVMKLTIDNSVPLTLFGSPQRTYLGGGEKWPEFKWQEGDKGFPKGKKGTSS